MLFEFNKLSFLFLDEGLKTIHISEYLEVFEAEKNPSDTWTTHQHQAEIVSDKILTEKNNN